MQVNKEKKRPKKVREYFNEAGHRISVYESGSEYNHTTRFITSPANTRITKETSGHMRRLRQEKMARLLRQAITREAAEKLVMSDRPTAAEALAEAGGILWAEVVLNKDAYPRDRLQTWETIGKHAGVLGDKNEPAPESDNIPAASIGRAAAEVVISLAKKLEQYKEKQNGKEE